MHSHGLRPIPARLPGLSGSASRCGVITILVVVLFVTFPAAGRVAAAPLEQRPAPEPLIAPPVRLVFLDARLESCAHDGGCVVELPRSPLPSPLVVPLRSHLPVAAARMLLPEPSRWLLASARGDLAGSGLIPAAPQVGRRARGESLPFDLVARADRLHVAAMFLIGLMLMLAGSALGLLVQSPAAPPLPETEPWIPGQKILPRLVAGPVSPAHIRSQPL